MKLKNLILILFLTVVLVYVTNITSIPKNIVLFEGENLNLGTIFGIIQNKEQVITTSNGYGINNIVKEEKIKLSLFNFLDVKNVNITTIENTAVIPLGNTVGLKLYANGVLVIGMTEIEGKKPYENTGIREGDLITYVNKNHVSTTQELVECVNSSNGKILNITYVRNGEEYVTSIAPVITTNKEYKLGLWVRDGAAGIGTATYYEPKTGNFAALGHGIIDADTNNLISIESGKVVTANIIEIQKGKEGNPRSNKRNNN